MAELQLSVDTNAEEVNHVANDLAKLSDMQRDREQLLREERANEIQEMEGRIGAWESK
jgi:hypothetical protein